MRAWVLGHCDQVNFFVSNLIHCTSESDVMCLIIAMIVCHVIDNSNIIKSITKKYD